MARYNFDVDGKHYSFDSDADPAEIKGAMPLVARSLRADASKGLPTKWRAYVGTAKTPETALETLRQFAPDAEIVPFGPMKGRMVYTDPETGKQAIHNPPGLDWGDVASVGREISGAVGGFLGGGAGAALGPGGVAAGIALAGQMGREAWDTAMSGFGPTIDERSLPEHLGDTAMETAADAVVSRGAIGLGNAIRGGVSKARNAFAGKEPAQVLNQFEAARIPTGGQAGAITGNRQLQLAEEALAKLPASSGRMQAAGEATQRGFDDAMRRMIASSGGTAADRYQAGVRLVEGLKGYRQNLIGKAGALHENLSKYGITDDAMMPADNLKKTILGWASRLEKTPAMARRALPGEAADLLDDIERNGGQLPWGAAKKIKGLIGASVGEPGKRSLQQSDKAALYRAFAQDAEAMANGFGPRALTAMKGANKSFRVLMKRGDDFLGNVIGNPDAERAFAAVVGKSNPTADAVRAVRKSVPKDVWDDIVAVKLREMGLPTPGARTAAAEFSPQTFLTSYSRTLENNKALREALFSGSRYAELRTQLDRLLPIMRGLRGSKTMVNYSNTASSLAWQSLLTGSGGAAGYASGDTPEERLTGAAAGAALGLGSPYIASRLMTSPGFIKWMIKGAEIPLTKPNSALVHATRLGRYLALDDADVRQAADEFTEIYKKMLLDSSFKEMKGQPNG